MAFIDLEHDPFADQFMFGCYGNPGSGKTELVLDLARAGQIVYLLSIDRGYSRARREATRLKGRLAVVTVDRSPEEEAEDAKLGRSESFTRYLYKRITEIVNVRVPRVIAKGVPSSNVWIVVDTVSHMQSRLLHESQAMQIQAGATKTFRVGKGDRSLPEYVAAELITGPEWTANAAVMAGINDFLLRAPCNIALLLLEKQDKIDVKDRNKTKAIPFIQGAAYQRTIGDLECLLWLSVQEDGSRTLRSKPTPGWEAKDRSGFLPEKMDYKRLDDVGGEPLLVQVRKLARGSSESTTPAAAAATNETKG